MNLIEQLRSSLSRSHPTAEFTLDAPRLNNGIWSLAIKRESKSIIVEWSEATGFAVTSAAFDSFGERPDESFQKLDDASRRVQILLNSTTEETSPRFGLCLARLRERRQITQVELAEKMGVKQATISGLERRGDHQLSTVRRYVCALGGDLQLHAQFSGAVYVLSIDGSSRERALDEQMKQSNVVAYSSSSYLRLFTRLEHSGLLNEALDKANLISQHGTIIEFERCGH